MPSTCPLCVREMTFLNKDALCKDCCDYTAIVAKSAADYAAMMATGKYVHCEDCGEPCLIAECRMYSGQINCKTCYETTSTMANLFKEITNIRKKNS